MTSVQLEQTYGSDGRVRTRTPTPFGIQDAWTVQADGWVAIARAADYHIEWISPTGTVSQSTPIPYKRLPVTDVDKKEYLERHQATALRSRLGTLSSNIDPRQALSKSAWPQYKPPFTGDLFIEPKGNLWIPITKAASTDSAFYDVVDKRGQVVRRVVLPPQTVLITVGREFIYTARIDADGLHYLQRRTR